MVKVVDKEYPDTGVSTWRGKMGSALKWDSISMLKGLMSPNEKT